MWIFAIVLSIFIENGLKYIGIYISILVLSIFLILFVDYLSKLVKNESIFIEIGLK